MRGMSNPSSGHRASPEYEWWVLNLPRDVSRGDAARLLAEHAEYGHWELDRVRLYFGGRRRIWLRRRIIRVSRTL